ncbi:MAG TPA: hypothetical protein VED86_01100 [archaeon]|nr:hypothetical protein [archaeon]
MILGTLQKLKPVEMDELIRTVKEHLLKQAKDNEGRVKGSLVGCGTPEPTSGP